MNINHTDTVTRLLAIDWVLLTTVMIGGQSLIRLQTDWGPISDHTQQYFRAGHAHAGILIGVGMIMLLVLDRTGLGSTAIIATWACWATGILLLAGGMFWHAYLGQPGQVGTGVWMTGIGGVVLMATAISVAVNLFRAG